MSDATLQVHWQDVYASKGEANVSWFEERSDISLDLIRATGVPASAGIIDIGGGAARLVDALAAAGFTDLSVLNLSANAFILAQARLGENADAVDWIVADVTQWQPARTYDVWHDRAAFHFLIAAEDRAAYTERMRQALPPAGHVIIGTFALDGPERCSGLPVQRHDAASIGAALGDDFALIESRRHDHVTPAGVTQHFQFGRFRRNG